jgi:hypothetical protein
VENKGRGDTGGDPSLTRMLHGCFGLMMMYDPELHAIIVDRFFSLLVVYLSRSRMPAARNLFGLLEYMSISYISTARASLCCRLVNLQASRKSHENPSCLKDHD